MPTCPTCHASYDADVRWCPADGTQLEVTQTREVAGATEPVVDPFAFEPTDRMRLSQARPPGPGTRIGEYEVTGKLGEGGMGVVYAGVQPVIGKKVAIKVLNATLSRDSTMVQRFIQEARAVNQIGHRNIIDIFSFGQLPTGEQYFVMELLPGNTLAERLETPPPPTFEEAFSYLLEVCEALIAAHAAGIVHRDLKPENIYLADAGRAERAVKLLDFGIAKLLNADERLSQTRTGVPMGTPYYMSPEQCRAAAIDGRTDIYALGVIMFELFTGELPFKQSTLIEVINAHLSQPPPSPSKLAEMPAELEALVLACLEKDPARRPQTAVEARDRLQQVGGSMGVWFSRRISAVHTNIGGQTPIRRTPAPETVSDQPVEAPRISRRWIVAGIIGAVIVGGAGLLLALQASRPPSIQVPAASAPPSEKSAAVPPARPPSEGGELEVRTGLAEATWTFDGEPAGDATGSFKRADVAPGAHTLRVEAKGFLPREERIEIEPRGLVLLEWRLTAAAAPAPSPPPLTKKSGAKPAVRLINPFAE